MESFSSNRYVNLLKNSGFKAVFGDENNKDVIVGVPVQALRELLLPLLRQAHRERREEGE